MTVEVDYCPIIQYSTPNMLCIHICMFILRMLELTPRFWLTVCPIASRDSLICVHLLSLREIKLQLTLFQTIDLITLDFIARSERGLFLLGKTLGPVNKYKHYSPATFRPQPALVHLSCFIAGVFVCSGLVSGHGHHQWLLLLPFAQQVGDHVRGEEKELHGVAELKKLQVDAQHPLEYGWQMNIPVRLLDK